MLVSLTERRLRDGGIIDLLSVKSDPIHSIEGFDTFARQVTSFSDRRHVLFWRWIFKIYNSENIKVQELVSHVYRDRAIALERLQGISRSVILASQEGGFVEEGLDSGAGYIDSNTLSFDAGGYVIIQGLLQE